MEDQLGCCCRAEDNECLNWRDSNGGGKKRNSVRGAQRLNPQCLVTG